MSINSRQFRNETKQPPTAFTTRIERTYGPAVIAFDIEYEIPDARRHDAEGNVVVTQVTVATPGYDDDKQTVAEGMFDDAWGGGITDFAIEISRELVSDACAEIERAIEDAA